MDQAAGPASSATARERLFMECDKQGRVLWMNQRARARLGPVASLFSALPPPHIPEASELLGSGGLEKQRTIVSWLQYADRPGRIPVQLVRVLTLENRVVLSAEVRARASDTRPPHQEIIGVLLALQSNAMRNYFRLRGAQEALANCGWAPKSKGASITQALEMERTRIARELHSGVGQTLAGVKVNLELIAARMPDPPELLQNGLGRIQALTDQAMSEIRSVSQRLHPPDWQRLDLLQAIEWLWITSGIPQKFHATLVLQPVVSDLPDAIRVVVYRAVQEGLANVLRHADAKQLKLAVGERDHQIFLLLEDNGTGFDVQGHLDGALAQAMRGIGLRAMRDQVQALNGSFQLMSGAGGTTVEITLPIEENR